MTFPVQTAIITASDRCSRGQREDKSGLLLKSLVKSLPADVIAYRILPDDKEILKQAFCELADLGSCDLVLTTGGTGLGPRDMTPEATREVIEKEVPGIPQALLRESARKTKFAMLSRAMAGIRGRTLIVNLPGSPQAVRKSFNILKPVLPHAIALLRGEVIDCRPLSSSALSHC